MFVDSSLPHSPCAVFVQLEEEGVIDPEEFRIALQEALREDVKIEVVEPFLWVKVEEDATREGVYIALEQVGEQLRYMAGRTVGYSPSW